MAKVFGVVKVRLNGVDYRTKPGATFEMGGETRTSQFASGKRTGTSREPTASKCSLSVEVMSDTDLEALRKFEGICEYVTDVGITYSAANSEMTEPPRLSDNGAGAELTIEGDPAVKV